MLISFNLASFKYITKNIPDDRERTVEIITLASIGSFDKKSGLVSFISVPLIWYEEGKRIPSYLFVELKTISEIIAYVPGDMCLEVPNKK